MKLSRIAEDTVVFHRKETINERIIGAVFRNIYILGPEQKVRSTCFRYAIAVL